MHPRFLFVILALSTSLPALAGNLLGDAAAEAGNAAGGSCPTGFTQRLTIINHCSDEVFAVFTPGGSPTQPQALANSGAWFRAYAAQGSGEHYIGTGAQGSGVSGSSTLTLTTLPGDTATYFQPGQFIKVAGGGSNGADLPTEVTAIKGNTLTLADPLQTTVTSAAITYNTLKGAVPIATGKSQPFCIPDQGAPSGNFSFFIGCPNHDPFADQGCNIGTVTGDLAGINTRFEPTFGCKPGSVNCAFNAADAAPNYPNCQTSPNATACGPLGSNDYFNVSVVDGYTVALQVQVTGDGCSSSLIDASMLDLASCPSENPRTLYPWPVISGLNLSLLTSSGGINRACVAPYQWLGSGSLGNPTNPSPSMDTTCGPAGCTPYSYYAAEGCLDDTPGHAAIACPGGSGIQQRVGPTDNGRYAIQNMNWTQQLYAMGYTGDTSRYDDAVGGQVCDWGATMTVTLCPANSSKKPDDATQQWAFSSGQCAISSTGTYPSLFACLTDPANAVLFTCDPLTDTAYQPAPGSLPFASARWKVDPAATANNGYTWAEVQALKTTPGALVCRKLTSNPLTPAGTNVTVTHCDYKYAPPYDPTDPAFAASSWCPAPR